MMLDRRARDRIWAVIRWRRAFRSLSGTPASTSSFETDCGSTRIVEELSYSLGRAIASQ
jgi:hypothetical protein